MLTPESLQFLYDLSQNNNRDWFAANKSRYEAVLKKPFERMLEALIDEVLTFDAEIGRPAARDCVYRIYRDTRFSADKTPYKTHISASITPGGRKTGMDSFPGYYIHLAYGALMLGGGAYMIDKPQLAQLRRAIAQDPQALQSILAAPDFKEHYGELRGEKNKILPPDFKGLQIPELYYKQFYFLRESDPEEALDPNFPKMAAQILRAGKDLNVFLRRALA
ncbi:MAG: DUF2461 domain-containing protein [Saprospiraceae bacterium]